MATVTISRNASRNSAGVGLVTCLSLSTNGIAVEAGLTPSYVFGCGEGGYIRIWQSFMEDYSARTAAGVISLGQASLGGDSIRKIDALTSYAYANASGELGASAGFVIDPSMYVTNKETFFFFYR